ncbi:MAG: NAD-dependent malic enzyme, partial [Gammaproteobacteria bacterium]|nr:NAD-dependent malic enzyme [Gammaproteobacteria bacterium]
QSERRDFNLDGLLPISIETIDMQEKRAYQQFCQFEHDLDKHIYLRNIQDTNETLYFKLITSHLEEMMPIIYTPTVGKACQLFSRIYRRKRGLFISYPDRDKIYDMLQNATKQNVKVIVVTDSERILGLGDQGIGGMGIPIGKLALYSGCGGISPAYTLPVTLDVGTNNKELLEDPMYMGWRHERITGDDYFNFVDEFLSAVSERWPNVLIQFEDFAQGNATPLLKKYQQKYCCFNDDIQGTASVTVGTLLAACHALGTGLKDHRVVFAGAGSAGCGIAEQIVAHMKQEGLSEEQAVSQIYLTNSKGLLTEDMPLRDFQLKFAKSKAETDGWSDSEFIDLLDLTRAVKPTIIIGVSGVAGLISQQVVETMYESCKRPIVLPLSNPTSKVEALPSDVINWTEGNAIVATGSPFNPVEFNGKKITIAQCNNSYIFPGVGLGTIVSKARHVTENMFMAASEALATCSPLVKGKNNDLLPPLDEIRDVSLKIAFAVARQAIADGVAYRLSDEKLRQRLEDNFWDPEYREYRRRSF